MSLSLRGLRRAFGNYFSARSRPSPSQHRPRRGRLRVRPLEDRSVPSVLFGTSGVESVTNYGTVLGSVNVELVFWGSGWGGGPSATSNAIYNAVSDMLTGPYMSGLAQYGAASRGNLVGQAFISDANPADWVNGRGSFVNDNVPIMLMNEMDHGGLDDDQPSDKSPMLYLVVPQAGVQNTSADGHHGTDVYPDGDFFGTNTTRFYYAWTNNNGPQDSNTTSWLDTITENLSHELVEAVTNPNGFTPGLPGGVEVTSTSPASEIADYLGGHGKYAYRDANGVLLQAYWSAANNLFMVPDGNQQVVSVSPTYDSNGNQTGTTLLIQGDQAGHSDDNITIGLTPFGSGYGYGGIAVTLNGESFGFAANGQMFPDAANQITNVVVKPGAGFNAVDVQQLPAGVTLDYDGGASVYDSVLLGNDIPRQGWVTAGILGQVNIHGNAGTTYLDIFDDGDSTSHTVTVGPTSVSGLLPGPALEYDGVHFLDVIDSQASSTYQVDDPAAAATVALPGGGQVSVRAVGYPLTVGSGGPATVTVSSTARTLDFITAPVTVAHWSGKPGALAVVVDDSGSATRRTFTQTATNITWGVPGAQINLGDGHDYGIGSVVLLGGSGGNIVAIQGTGSPTTVVNNGPDEVAVGNNGSLAGLQGAVTVYGNGTAAVSVDDSADSTPYAEVTLQNGTLSGLGPVPITVTGVTQLNAYGNGSDAEWVIYDTAAFPAYINTGSGGDGTASVYVLATTSPLTIDGGGGSPTVSLGNSALLNLQGAVTVENGGGNTTLLINNGSDTTDHPNVKLNYGSLTGLAPSAIQWSPTALHGLDLYGGTGLESYTIDNPGLFPTRLHPGNAKDPVTVKSNTGLVALNDQVLANGVGQLAVSVPTGPVTAGKPFQVTVTAQDTNGNALTTYGGTVTLFSLDLAGNADQSGLPADYTFTPADQGRHTFTVRLNRAGSESFGAYEADETNSYSVQSGANTLTINPATPTVAATAPGGTYNGSAFAAGGSAVGLDGVTPVTGSWAITYYAGTTATGTPLPDAPTDAGTYTAVAAFTSSDPNYSDGSAQATYTITPAPLTVAGITANDKAYDGTTAATLDFSHAALQGVIGSDQVSLDTSTYAGSFAGPGIGNGVGVTVSGLRLAGSQAGDYTLTQPAGLTANITPAPNLEGQLSQLRQQYGFYSDGNYYQGSLGLNEKWVQDRAGKWYVLRPDGRIQPWLGGTSLGSPVATVNAGVWNNPGLLLQADLRPFLPAGDLGQLASLRQQYGFISGGNYYQNDLGLNEKWIQGSAGQWFVLGTNGQIRPWLGGHSLGAAVATVNPLVWDDPELLLQADLGQLLTAADQTQLSALRVQYGFSSSGNYYQNFLGHNEKWIQDKTGQWYVIRTDGQVQPWQSGTGLGSTIATVNAAVWNDPGLLLQAALSLSADARSQLATLSQGNGFHFGGNYYLNWLNQGLNEKWFQDASNHWYYITPQGVIYRGNGSRLAQVDPQVWDDPSLLFEAKLPAAGQAQLHGLEGRYGFHFSGGYSQGYDGLNAKWFQDRRGFWYAVRTDGSLQLWLGQVNGADAFATVAGVDPAVWTDPYLLFQA